MFLIKSTQKLLFNPIQRSCLASCDVFQPIILQKLGSPLSQVQSFHTSPHYLSRYPPVQPRISRYQHARNMRRIYFIKKRLGDKYRTIGRDKRKSPFSPVKKATKIAQDLEGVKLQAEKEVFRLGEYLAYPGAVQPPALNQASLENDDKSGVDHTHTKKTPGEKTLEQVLQNPNIDFIPPTKATEAVVGYSSTRNKGNVRTSSKATSESTDEVSADVENTAAVNRDLSIDASVIPKVVSSVSNESSKSSPESDISSLAPQELKTASGPYYQFGLSPSEVKFLLDVTPKTLAAEDSENASQLLKQAELLRRIISLEAAGSKQLKKWNVRRMMEIFQRSKHDTGSPEVQAAVLTVHIQDMKNHLSIHKKDTKSLVRVQVWEKQRKKILQYLRRKNLAKFVDTCLAIGVDPDTIRAKA